MDGLVPLIFLGILGLALVWTIVALIARSIGALVKLAMRPREESVAYGRNATKATYVALIGLIGNQIFTAIYPTEDFYLAEFETVISRKRPVEAKVIEKSATYPDFHGDYCSFSRIEISASSYRKLLFELTADKRFTSDGDSTFSEDGLPAGILQPLRIVRAFVRSDAKSDRRESISFLGNGTQIEVHICVT